MFISKWDNTHIAGGKELQFFVLNGMDQVFHYCNRTLFDLSNCEINNTKDLEVKMNLLLSSGFGVLVICLFITVPFAEYFINRENNLWNQIKMQAHGHYEALKINCLERLLVIHNKTDTLFSDSKHTSKTANFKNRWKYLWRNSLYFVLALIFFLVNYFYLYHNCAAFLHLRPSLLRSIINSQVLYKTLLVWTSEALVTRLPSSLIYQTPEQYPFIDAYNKLDIVIESLKFSEKEIRSSKYSPLLSEEFKEIFYKKTEGLREITDYGIYSAGGIIPLDVYYLEYSGRSDWLVMWFKFSNDAIILDLEYDLLIDLANKDSQNVILGQLQWIIIAMIIFVLISFILYFWCYLFFLAGEKKNLEKMKIISRLIPRK
ncbi:unnamed protein product [Blepharisma stoltei]|uniref:Uncharacterized protein n=1 Tax=Blepharisma stoltei TaxID=1481888 RepID=A0AAU9J9K0_9CILI|nr:unnamed protein product [Blepharisma stoltei]